MKLGQISTAESPFIQYPHQRGKWSVAAPVLSHTKAQRLNAKREFVEWLRETYPAIYEAALKETSSKGAPGLSGYVPGFTQDMNVRSAVINGQMGQGIVEQTEPDIEQASEGWLSSLIDNAGKVGKAWLAYDYQKKILNENISRSKTGQPPLAEEYIPPAATIKVKAATENIAQIIEGFGPVVLIGGAALLWLMMRK